MKTVLIITVASAALIGCTQPQSQPAPVSAPTQGGVGRFTIIHGPDERDTILLDTVNGHTWQLVNNGTEQAQDLAWRPVHRPAGEERPYALQPLPSMSALPPNAK